MAVTEVADELYRMADRWWHGEGPPAERVRLALEGVVSVYAENADLLRVTTEVSTYDEEVRGVWLAIIDRFIEATAEHIRSEQEKGLIAPRLEPRATAESLVWMNERLLLHLPGPRRAQPGGPGRGDGARLDRRALSRGGSGGRAAARAIGTVPDDPRIAGNRRPGPIRTAPRCV